MSAFMEWRRAKRGKGWPKEVGDTRGLRFRKELVGAVRPLPEELPQLRAVGVTVGSERIVPLQHERQEEDQPVVLQASFQLLAER